jgi:UDP-N-acetyl-D-mannosaminuronic acid dehydrogenase
MKLCVVGLGYIGLPTSAVFADHGHDVIGVDVNEHVVKVINNGSIHIEEEGLGTIVKKVVNSGRLRASTTPEKADIFIIAVPTPVHSDFSANIDYVKSAVESILPYLEKGNVVIVESTIPPRTIDDVVVPIIRDAGFDVENDIFVAHCPERVIPGKILHEIIHNTRIVGGYTKKATEKAADVYRLIVKGDILGTTALTAEMAKLMENTYRDVNIALANELVRISERLQVNAHEVIALANRHPRVNIHLPGPGVGGHCIAVDPYFIIEKAQEEAQLITTARKINSSMPQFVVDKVNYLVSEVVNPKIALFGLAYKGNVDDIRESPAIHVYELLKENARYNISVYDPHVKQEQTQIPLSSFEEAIEDANLILILTDHNEFKNINADILKEKMKNPVVFDTRNCVEIDETGVILYRLGDLGDLKSIQ